MNLQTTFPGLLSNFACHLVEIVKFLASVQKEYQGDVFSETQTDEIRWFGNRKHHLLLNTICG